MMMTVHSNMQAEFVSAFPHQNLLLLLLLAN